MTTLPPISLTGNTLTAQDIVEIGVGGRNITLDPEALERCHRSRTFLEKELTERKIIYGVNASFGPICDKIINDRDIEELQENLIIRHAAGLGEPLSPSLTLGILAVRLNTLVKGYSGVRIELLELMCNMVNSGLAPYIPECCSVGASGDLIHLAHMALAIIGKGNVYLDGELMDAKKAFAATGLSPVRLSSKEGLALINGTAAMTAIAAFAFVGAEKLYNVVCINDAFDMSLHRIKLYPGQIATAQIIRKLYSGTGKIRAAGTGKEVRPAPSHVDPWH